MRLPWLPRPYPLGQGAETVGRYAVVYPIEARLMIESMEDYVLAELTANTFWGEVVPEEFLIIDMVGWYRL